MKWKKDTGRFASGEYLVCAGHEVAWYSWNATRPKGGSELTYVGGTIFGDNASADDREVLKDALLMRVTDRIKRFAADLEPQP